MSDGLEPRDDGTVCCVCRKPIVPHADAVHGAYVGVEARHYACTVVGRYGGSAAALKALTLEVGRLAGEADALLDLLRGGSARATPRTRRR